MQYVNIRGTNLDSNRQKAAKEKSILLQTFAVAKLSDQLGYFKVHSFILIPLFFLFS